MKGFARGQDFADRRARKKVELEAPPKLLSLKQPQIYWGRKGQRHDGKRLEGVAGGAPQAP